MAYIKELVVSYKSIFINTYNVLVYDLSLAADKRATLYIHESFQLWEDSISGMILGKNKDFVNLTKSGIKVLNLGTSPYRIILDKHNRVQIIHSLAAFNYLKLD